MGSVRILGSSCIHAAFEASGKLCRRPPRFSGALLLSLAGACCAISLGSRNQVIGGVTEDEQSVHLFQSTYLDLTQRAGLLRPSATEADGVAGLSCCPSVEVAAASMLVLRNMRSDI